MNGLNKIYSSRDMNKALHQMAKDNNVYLHPNIACRYDESKNLRGIFATDDIKKDETMMKLTKESLDLVVLKWPIANQTFEYDIHNTKRKYADDSTKGAAEHANAIISRTQKNKHSLESRNSYDFFLEYFKLLDSDAHNHPNINDQFKPFMFHPCTRNPKYQSIIQHISPKLYCGPLTFQQCALNEWNSQFEHGNENDEKQHDEKQHDEKENDKKEKDILWHSNDSKLIFDDKNDFEKYKHIVYHLLSRSMEQNTWPRRVHYYPFIDLINHHRTPNAYWESNRNMKSGELMDVSVTSSKFIKKGDEISIKYIKPLSNIVSAITFDFVTKYNTRHDNYFQCKRRKIDFPDSDTCPDLWYIYQYYSMDYNKSLEARKIFDSKTIAKEMNFDDAEFFEKYMHFMYNGHTEENRSDIDNFRNLTYDQVMDNLNKIVLYIENEIKFFDKSIELFKNDVKEEYYCPLLIELIQEYRCSFYFFLRVTNAMMKHAIKR